MKRRDFLKNSGILTAAAISFPAIIPASAKGANEKLRVATIGCGQKTFFTGTWWDRSAWGLEVAYVCDPVKERRDKVAAERIKGTTPVEDFRELLDKDDVDIFNIVTPTYWHVPVAIQAAKAGKALYCQKPMGLALGWNKKLRKAVRDNSTVFQYGTQICSTTSAQLGIEMALNGVLGEIKEVYVWCPAGASGGDETVVPIPEGWNYDLWTGPSPMHEFSKGLCISKNGCMYNYDFAIGYLANWGSHPLEALQLWADELGMGIPVEYQGAGKYNPEDLYNSVTHWDIEGRYANGVKFRFCDCETINKYVNRPEMFTKGIGMTKPKSYSDTTMLVGDKGAVAFGYWGMMTDPVELRAEAKNLEKRHLVQSTNHIKNLVDAVRGETKTITNAESAFRSDAVSHLSDIAIRTGRQIKWDPEAETIPGDPEAAAMLDRKARDPYDKLLEV